MNNPQWLELPMSRTNFHGPKDIRASEVFHWSLVKVYPNIVWFQPIQAKNHIFIRISDHIEILYHFGTTDTELNINATIYF